MAICSANPDAGREGHVDYVSGQYAITIAGTATSSVIGIANGATSSYTGHLDSPVKAGSVTIDAGELRAVDTGSELSPIRLHRYDRLWHRCRSCHFSSCPGTSGTSSNVTVSYRNRPAASGKSITASYKYAKSADREWVRL